MKSIPPEPRQISATRLIRTRVSLLLLAFVFLWLLLWRQLSYEWSTNQQYNYGWFVPFFAGFLFWRRWGCWRGKLGGRRTRKDIENRNSSSQNVARFTTLLLAFVLLFLLLPIRLFEVANPDWRLLSWLHALAVVSLTLLFLYWSAGGPILSHLAFPVCFMLVAVPWVSPIEQPLVQGLMRFVAATATETLQLLGIPAQLMGNVIQVNGTILGVSEACSGVRSFQTSLMIALLFGELKWLTISRRFLLLAVALLIALVGNLGRAVLLVYVNANTDTLAAMRWHEIAGYSVITLVIVGTFSLASVFARSRTARQPIPGVISHSRKIFFRIPPLLLSAVLLGWLLLVEGAVESWYRWHEQTLVPTQGWNVRWPETASEFHILPIEDNVRSTLRYDVGQEASWKLLLPSSAGEPGQVCNCRMFFFRWKPGSSSIVRARAHRPDVCLPNIGWRLDTDAGLQSYQVTKGVTLSFRHFQFVRQLNGQRLFAETFFCQHEDRVLPDTVCRADITAGETERWGWSNRLRVVRQGLRNQGQQIVELIMITPGELGAKPAEAEFGRLVSQLIEVTNHR